MILPSNYDRLDFNKLYKEQRTNSSFIRKSVAKWDVKAASFSESVLKSHYVKDFISRVDFEGARTLLDFACGAGALSIAAANKVDKIYGYDFSPKMLEFAEQNSRDFNCKNIEFAQKAFEDDFSDVPECDITFASRCLDVDDLKQALEKLLSKTKKALYITFKVGSFINEDVLNALGSNIEKRPDFIYLINILFQMGYLPKLEYIQTSCSDGMPETIDDLVKKIQWGLSRELTEPEVYNLNKYFNGNRFEQKQEHMNWAFIRVDKYNTKK